MKLAKRNPTCNKGDSVSTCKIIPSMPKKLGLVGVIVHKGFIMAKNINGISQPQNLQVNHKIFISCNLLTASAVCYCYVILSMLLHNLSLIWRSSIDPIGTDLHHGAISIPPVMIRSQLSPTGSSVLQCYQCYVVYNQEILKSNKNYLILC